MKFRMKNFVRLLNAFSVFVIVFLSIVSIAMIILFILGEVILFNFLLFLFGVTVITTGFVIGSIYFRSFAYKVTYDNGFIVQFKKSVKKYNTCTKKTSNGYITKFVFDEDTVRCFDIDVDIDEEKLPI